MLDSRTLFTLRSFEMAASWERFGPANLGGLEMGQKQLKTIPEVFIPLTSDIVGYNRYVQSWAHLAFVSRISHLGRLYKMDFGSPLDIDNRDHDSIVSP
jgi:hypothetical protein